MQLTYTFLGLAILSSVPPSHCHIIPNMGLRRYSFSNPDFSSCGGKPSPFALEFCML
jgi:hypothetical protein